MIYIDNSKLPAFKIWKKEDKKLTAILAKMEPRNRSSFMNRRKSRWGRYKRRLENLSHGKCWYCEVKYPRDFFQVDHYRPKNLVRGEDGRVKLRSGYWWLAFNHRNYRLACALCNCPHKGPDGQLRGKVDCFPLFNDTRRARSPQHDLKREKPLLLDPADPADPPLLFFRDDGRVHPFYKKKHDRPYRRAMFTIHLLDLNSKKLRDERREVYMECKNLQEDADSAFKRYLQDENDEQSYNQYRKKVAEIRKRASAASEYAATARTCFLGSGYPWVKQVVTT